MQTKREADPLLSPQALLARIPDYTAGQDAALGLISPIFADRAGRLLSEHLASAARVTA